MDVWIKGLKYALILLLVFGLEGLIRGSGRQADFQVLSGQVLKEMDLDEMQQGDERMLRRLYGLNAGEFLNWTLYISKDNMDVKELLLLEAAAPEEVALAEQAVRKRLEIQEHNFEGYGPEQLQLLKKSVIRVEGSCLLFVVAEDPETVKDGFVRALYGK